MNPAPEPDPERRWGAFAARAAGIALVGCAAALTAMSFLTAAGTIPRDLLPAFNAGLGIAAGGGVLVALRLVGPRLSPRWVVACGLAARVVLLPCPATLEDDYYRYLWDGAVTAHAMNPYERAPRDVQEALGGRGSVDPALAALGREAGPILERINHAELPTVYPPVAQVVFAASHVLFGWSLVGWRVVLLVADAGTLALIFGLLRALGRPAWCAAWYWWNPVVLMEVSRNAHFEPFVLVSVTAAALLAVRGRHVAAVAAAATAAAVKLWPVLLLPLLLRPLVRRPRRLVLGLLVVVCILAGCYLALAQAGAQALQGFAAYGRSWENNDGFFRAVLATAEQVLPVFDIPAWNAQAVTRWTVVGLVALWTGLLSLRAPPCAEELVRRCLWIVAALFLTGPTQFPWYFLWLLPFLTAFPRNPLHLYVALLPLYYLHYAHPSVLWLEHVPVWVLLSAQAWRAMRRGGTETTPSAERVVS